MLAKEKSPTKASKVLSVSKKKVVKTTIKKSVPKKPTTKNLSKKPAVKSTKPKTVSIKKTVNKKTVVKDSFKVEKTLPQDTVSFIPGNISLRLKERRAIYENWYKVYAPTIVRPTAQIFGYVFIVIGIFSMYLSIGSFKGNLDGSNLMAFLPCAEVGCTASTTNLLETPVVVPPQVIFLTSPLVTPNTNTPLTVQILNVSEYSLFVISAKNGLVVKVEHPTIDQENKYLYNIPTADLPSGEYLVQVKVSATDGKTKSVFSGPSFVVPELIKETAIVRESESSTSTSTETTSTSPVLTENKLPEIKTAENSVATTTKIIEKVAVSTTTEKTVAEKPEDKILLIEPKTDAPITLSLIPTDNKLQYRLFIKSNFTYDRVEIFARSKQAQNALYLGVASKASDGLYYWLDSTNLPNGSYTIIAKGVVNKEVRDTAEIRFDNTVVIKPVVSTTTKERLAAVEKNTATGTVDLINLRVNIFTDNNLIGKLNPNEPEATTSEKVRNPELAKTLIDKRGEELDKLFANYASAVAVGEEDMIRLSEQELKKSVDKIASDGLLSSDSNLTFAELQSVLDAEVSRVQKQIGQVNTLLKERTNDDSAKDTDKDGISDFDETVIYKTNPNNPDTDGDGFNDGIEITTGYDPLNASPEAIIAFSSPKDVNYVNDEVVSVKAITPLLNYEPDQTKPNVYSEITGKAIPNSFVTLYIYSNPIVVTVKTDSEGNFSYIFNKELEDGDHEVYVAMTDNTGSVVVRSNPLKFVKTAEAYSYVNASNESPVVTTSPTTYPEFKLFNLVAAMGIVSFGLILILLGKSVVAKREEVPVSV